MASETCKHSIYLLEKNIRISVPQEIHKEYYAVPNRLRKQQVKLKACSCPQQLYFECSMCCSDCKYSRPGMFCSLDEPVSRDNSILRHEIILDSDNDPFSMIVEKELHTKLRATLAKLSQEDQMIAYYIMHHLPMEELAQKIGIPKTTLAYRKKKLLNFLRQELISFI